MQAVHPSTPVTVASVQITHHGGDDYDKIVRGDPGVESIYNWTVDGPEIGYRGANGKGDGVHILTGQGQASAYKARALIPEPAAKLRIISSTVK